MNMFRLFYVYIAHHYFNDTTSPGFGWDRVNFLSSSWYRVVFWVQYEKNVDNILMFSVVAVQCLY